MTSKLVVNTIESDTGISSVSFASSISMSSTSKFHFSAAGIDIGADTNINRPSAGVLGFNINDSQKVVITSNGRLGIGENSPDTMLHVTGSDNVLGLFESTDADSLIQFKDNSTSDTILVGALGGDDLLLRCDAGNLIFNLGNNSEKARFDSSGRLLIGTTTEGHPAGDNLTVADSSNAGITIRSGTTSNGALYFSDGTSGADEYRGGVVYHHDGNYMRFYTNGTERIRIDSSGKFHVKTNGMNLENATATNSRGYSITNAAGTTGWTFGNGITASAHQYVIYDNTAGAARFQINGSGAFGLAGGNYGSSGEVLQSRGSSNTPTWATPASNSPAFQAYRSGDYTATNGTEVVLDFDQETFDTDSCYNFNNGRFTPTTSGYYIFYLNYYWSGTTSNNIKQAHTYIRKNGSDNLGQFWIDPHDSYRDNRLGMSVTCAASMNGSSDYVEAIGYCLINGGNPRFNSGGAVFGGFKLAT